ncbi:MAG: hypothetical protein ACREDS_08305 [Limisphaerales bacterium]
MIFGIVFSVVLVLIIVVLVKGLQRPSRVAHNSGGIPADAVSNDPPRFNETNLLAADRAEYFDLLERHSADPLHVPPPIPPSKPHPYWGNEANVFGNGAVSGEDVD